MTKKLYCYVDETGQDTQGRFFLVALVIVGKEREELRRLLQRIERISGKAAKKWTNATLELDFCTLGLFSLNYMDYISSLSMHRQGGPLTFSR